MKRSSASSALQTAAGLSSGTTYYFVVRTVTNPHTNNQNKLTSDYAPEVNATLP